MRAARRYPLLEQLPIGFVVWGHAARMHNEMHCTTFGEKSSIPRSRWCAGERVEMIKRCQVHQFKQTFRYRTSWLRRQTVEAVKPLSFTLLRPDTGDYRRVVQVPSRWQNAGGNRPTWQRV